MFLKMRRRTFYGDFDLVSLLISLRIKPDLITYESEQTVSMIHCLKRNIEKQIYSINICNKF